jgi:hypothetical protein
MTDIPQQTELAAHFTQSFEKCQQFFSGFSLLFLLIARIIFWQRLSIVGCHENSPLAVVSKLSLQKTETPRSPIR